MADISKYAHIRPSGILQPMMGRDPILELGKAWATALSEPWFLLCLQMLTLAWML